MASMTMTAPTPMMMPRADRQVRSLLAKDPARLLKIQQEQVPA